MMYQGVFRVLFISAIVLTIGCQRSNKENNNISISQKNFLEQESAGQTIQRKKPLKSQIPHHFFQASDGVKIHYLAKGSKNNEVIILLHGSMAGAQLNWWDNGVISALSKNYRVLAMDLRGYGPVPNIKVDSYGDQVWKDVLELMDHESVDNAHFHGYSLGGEILQILIDHFVRRGSLEDKVLSLAFGGSGIEGHGIRYYLKTNRDKKPTALVEAREEAALGVLKQKGSGDLWDLLKMEVFNSYSTKALKRLDIEDINDAEIPVLAQVGEYDKPRRKLTRMREELHSSLYTEYVHKNQGHLSLITPNIWDKKYLKNYLRFLKNL